MATTKRQTHLTGFKDTDHDILVKIVKGAQYRQIKGKQGDWKDFVANVNKKRGGTFSDPAKQPLDVLAAFVQTFTKKEDVELVRRMRSWTTYCEDQKLLNETHPFAKSPEQELVEITQSHPRFSSFYNFQSWMEGWKQSKRGDPNSPVKLISLDCEMVVCEGDAKELVRVCAVGSDCETFIDELVVPDGKVTDYITDITGVSEKDLQGVTFSQDDAQKLVMDLLTPGTILVGHSLHHDLKALRIDHKRVIDTSLLFRDPSWPPSYLPSLSNLCQAILKYNFREDDKPHDCLDDSIVPMRLVHYWLGHDMSSLSLDFPRKEVNRENLSRLFLHKLPMSIPFSSVRSIFPKHSACRIQDIVYKSGGKTGSTVAIFESAEEADNAFEHLKGVFAKDSGGYPQKLVTLMYPAGYQMKRAEIQVRKMVNSRSVVATGPESEELQMSSGSRKRALVSDENIVVTKRRRISDSSGDIDCSKEEGQILEGKVNGVLNRRCCCSHSQELEFVKSELAKVWEESKARADEIKSLQKLVAALSRRQGLA